MSIKSNVNFDKISIYIFCGIYELLTGASSIEFVATFPPRNKLLLCHVSILMALRHGLFI